MEMALWYNLPVPYKNKEEAAACKRRYYDKNRQECIERSRQWRLDNTERYNQYCRNRYASRLQEFRQIGADRMQGWRRKHPEKHRHAVKLQRAKRKLAPGHHTLEQWLYKVEYHGWRCFYCGRKVNYVTVTQDHLIPLSRGGTNWVSNLVPACRSCNSSKGARKLKH
jgi:5-methylcytosine-specific restriction endonuclease McrA